MEDFVITHRAGRANQVDTTQELAGAVLTYPKTPSGDRDGPPFYRLITLPEMDRYLDQGEEIIYGGEEEVIEAELLRRHPSPAGTSLLLQQDAYVTPREKSLEGTSYLRRRNRGKKQLGEIPSGWLLLDRPYVDTNDIDVIRERVNALGPILVPAGGESCYERWRAEGFVMSNRWPELWQVNYNPQAIRMAGYKNEQKRYAEKMRGYFTYDAMNLIFNLVSEVPTDVPDRGRINITSRVNRYGEEERPSGRWNDMTSDSRERCIDKCVELAADVFAAERIIKRLSPGAKDWYVPKDKQGAYVEDSALCRVIHTMLPWLHGVEAFSSLPHEERYVEPLWHGDEDAATMLRFCKWLRLWMRRLKIKPPPKPVAPVKPTTKRLPASRRAGSKGSGAKARRSRRKSAAPA
jgi:hypothetical protein